MRFADQETYYYYYHSHDSLHSSLILLFFVSHRYFSFISEPVERHSSGSQNFSSLSFSVHFLSLKANLCYSLDTLADRQTDRHGGWLS